jgi:hypothetical protein
MQLVYTMAVLAVHSAALSLLANISNGVSTVDESFKMHQ